MLWSMEIRRRNYCRFFGEGGGHYDDVGKLLRMLNLVMEGHDDWYFEMQIRYILS